jgi:hypothetical protein
MMDDDECGAVGGQSWKGNRNTGINHVSVPLCPPQIPHDLAWAGTWAAPVGK